MIRGWWREWAAKNLLFAVPSVNPVDGLLMAEKIRKGVELQPFTWQQKTLYLTVSIGVGSGRASY
ncbi:diguanylate cyclase [Escherichia coli]|nr:diguanylate cyclase [Escherichia coli]